MMLPSYQNKIEDIRNMLKGLIFEIIEAHKVALDAYETRNLDQFDKVKTILKTIQMEANAIDNEIVKAFALFGPEANELRRLISYLKMTNELIRIGEGAKKYARRMKEHCQSECNLKELDDIIIKLHKSSISALELIADCFKHYENCDYGNLYRSVMVEESIGDDIHSILEKEILSRIIIEGKLSIEYVEVLKTLRKLERAADHAVNIANLMLYSEEGGEIKSY